MECNQENLFILLVLQLIKKAYNCVKLTQLFPI